MISLWERAKLILKISRFTKESSLMERRLARVCIRIFPGTLMMASGSRIR